ncbi:hypothetical protein MRX96_024854 [Rhipicephalus microplus]
MPRQKPLQRRSWTPASELGTDTTSAVEPREGWARCSVLHSALRSKRTDELAVAPCRGGASKWDLPEGVPLWCQHASVTMN